MNRALSLACFFLSASVLHAEPPPDYALVWKDEFDGPQLDLTKWTPANEPRQGGQSTPDAVTLSEGVMTIRTWTEGGKHFTGYLRTRDKYEPTYGYFEARIRFHSTPGEWGAFWLMSPTMGRPLGDIAKAGAEIDVIEHRASDGKKDVTRLMGMALHWDGYGKEHRSQSHPGGPAPGEASLQGNWHTYALLWTPEHYVFSLDGKVQWETKAAVSQRSEFLILSCEVHDQSWAGNVPAGGFGAKAEAQTKMEVDWVRVWQKPAPAK